MTLPVTCFECPTLQWGMPKDPSRTAESLCCVLSAEDCRHILDFDCKRPSLLLNNRVKNVSFIGPGWAVSTKAQYAGTIIAVIIFTFTLELLRRLGRQYDRHLVNKKNSGGNFFEQLLRALLYTLQVINAYTLILFAVSFNVGVIVAIFVGTYFAFLVSSWGEPTRGKPKPEKKEAEAVPSSRV
ncbi:Ctr copper transporter family-domain-containing protein [Cercophora scortea]|uniref:Copper transport protein n=1 Tax=Cercophora scortea TaxID=314031 RepID=A0AAE0J3N0_9PEZI|nr:Ctr copper transporter family-domain-containing protein [Cercophora scortea]